MTRSAKNRWYDATDPRFIYFFQAVSGGPIKIGVAGDPAKRLIEIQLGNPEQLRIIGVIPGGGRSHEQGLHARFRQSRLHGEWFEPVPALLSFIEETAVAYRTPPSPWLLIANGQESSKVAEEDVLTLAQVAELTSWSEKGLERDCRAGRFSHVRNGRRFGMTRPQIHVMVALHQAGPGPAGPVSVRLGQRGVA